jgi:hypothetical protein
MSAWHISVFEFTLLSLYMVNFRFGPMNAISLVGTKQEECGNYFEELVRVLEQCPFLRPLMPWGEWSAVDISSPADSDDGPIFWIRPGEQLIRTDELLKDEQVANANASSTNSTTSSTTVSSTRGRKRSATTSNSSSRNTSSLGLAIR